MKKKDQKLHRHPLLNIFVIPSFSPSAIFISSSATRMEDGGPTPQFITVGFQEDPNDPDKPIAVADVVRPPNHRWCLLCGADAKRFEEKSRARCPTYGNCTRCDMSGPVGERCQECVDECVGYTVVLYELKIVDAQFLATLLGKGHVVAKANRKFSWIRTPCESIDDIYRGFHVKLDAKQRASRASASPLLEVDLFVDAMREDHQRRFTDITDAIVLASSFLDV